MGAWCSRVHFSGWRRVTRAIPRYRGIVNSCTCVASWQSVGARGDNSECVHTYIVGRDTLLVPHHGRAVPPRCHRHFPPFHLSSTFPPPSLSSSRLAGSRASSFSVTACRRFPASLSSRFHFFPFRRVIFTRETTIQPPPRSYLSDLSRPAPSAGTPVASSRCRRSDFRFIRGSLDHHRFLLGPRRSIETVPRLDRV